MTILDFVRITRINLKTLVLSVILGMAVAYAYTLFQPTLYQATSTATIHTGSATSLSESMSQINFVQSKAATYTYIAGSENVVDQIVKDSEDQLARYQVSGSVSAEIVAGTPVLRLHATSGSPQVAQKIANLAPEALNKVVKFQETNGKPDRAFLEIRQATKAGLPSSPISPNRFLNLGIGAFAGLLLGYIIVVLRKQLDSRVRHVEDIEKITGAGVLGVIPKVKELSDSKRGGIGKLGGAAESMRMLRTNLRYLVVDQPPRSLVITSSSQGEGKSTVAANLARVLASAGQRVMMIDTDLRRPVLARTFGIDGSVGLTDVLAGRATLSDAVQQGDHPLLSILPAGRVPPNPSELLGSRRMQQVIHALSKEYFVLLDAPPLLPVTDAGLLSVATDGAVVVYEVGVTRKEEVQLCTKILEQVGGKYLGSVLNMAPRKQLGTVIYGYGHGAHGAGGYGYGYGYGYGRPTETMTEKESDFAPSEDHVSGDQVKEIEEKKVQDEQSASTPDKPKTGDNSATEKTSTKDTSASADNAEAPSRRSLRRQRKQK